MLRPAPCQSRSGFLGSRNNEEAETIKKELIDLSAKRKKEMEFSKENMTNEKKLLMKVLNKI